MKATIYTLLAILLMVQFGQCQERYYSELFSDVKVTLNVKYGTNISIAGIILGLTSEPAPEDLYMDVYEPEGDTLSERPVVIFAHAGDFLPPVINQTPYGSRGDSAVVEICRDMARRGFVAISMSYRLGWNPFAKDQEIKAGVLQAAYRLSQDMHTVVRYLRMDYAEQDNTFRINPRKIVVGGFDSAGWGAANLVNLKDVSQIQNLVKFVDLSTTPPTPFIIEELHGNPQATNEAILNIPNHVGYSSEVSAVINLEGGVGDISWIESGDKPVIAFQRKSTFPRAGIRDVTLTAGGPIIIPTGAFVDTIVYTSQELGNQDEYINAGFTDELTLKALSETGNLEGLYIYDGFKVNRTEQCDPTPGADPDTYGTNQYPWNWYDEAIFGAIWDAIPNQTIPSSIYICAFNASQGNTNDPEVSRIFIDTMTNYIVPRIVVSAETPEVLTNTVDNKIKKEIHFQAFPNPTTESILFRATQPMHQIDILDANGRILYRVGGLNDLEKSVNLQLFANGIYFARIQFSEGIISEKIIKR